MPVATATVREVLLGAGAGSAGVVGPGDEIGTVEVAIDNADGGVDAGEAMEDDSNVPVIVVVAAICMSVRHILAQKGWVTHQQSQPTSTLRHHSSC